MRRIAVTGGPAEGKSTVLGYLRQLGYATASADEEARRVFSGAPIQSWLRDRLGEGVPVTPPAVRARLASDAEFRRELNERMHPLVLERIFAGRAQFVEVPLLVEACLQGRFDRVWAVTCGPDEQMRRLEARLGDRSLAEALLATQLPSRVKCAFADRVFRTNAVECDVLNAVTEAVAHDLL